MLCGVATRSMPKGQGAQESTGGLEKAWAIQQRQRRGKGLPLSKVHLLSSCSRSLGDSRDVEAHRAHFAYSSCTWVSVALASSNPFAMWC
jgi:hypothetical protein